MGHEHRISGPARIMSAGELAEILGRFPDHRVYILTMTPDGEIRGGHRIAILEDDSNRPPTLMVTASRHDPDGETENPNPAHEDQDEDEDSAG